MTLWLAKGGEYRDQEWYTHAEITRDIAKMISELRNFSEIHRELLIYSSYFHDIGKKIFKTHKGNHKLQFEECCKEIKSKLKDSDEDTISTIAHIILRNHYTSKKDIKKLEEIYIPSNVNIDLILRNLRACDWLASLDYINLEKIEKVSNQLDPLKLFAYIITREGILAGKIMDIIDSILIEEGGKGIYYHNGSIFLFREGQIIDLNKLKIKLKKKLMSFSLKYSLSILEKNYEMRLLHQFLN